MSTVANLRSLKGLSRNSFYFFVARLVLLGVFWMLSTHWALAQTTYETIPAQSYIVNMGISQQTQNNALRPYGMIYDLLKNNQVPIKWAIKPNKTSLTEVDFTYGSTSFISGAFIILAQYRTSAIDIKVNSWKTSGVQVITTTTPIANVPIYTTLTNAPKWTINDENTSISGQIFANAGVPTSAYVQKPVSTLNGCDDIYVMPHADPEWATHGGLLNWNLVHKGSIWLGCHAGSALELMYNPANRAQQTNFLSNKTGTAAGNGKYAVPSNSLIHWDDHGDGTPPYSYDHFSEPVMQFRDNVDAAVNKGGSERIYVPTTAGWRSTTKLGVWDPDHPDRVSAAPQHRAAPMVWGRGFGESDRGQVMMTGSHKIFEEGGVASIAAQRAFWNFSLIEGGSKSPTPTMTGLPTTISSGGTYTLSFTLPAGVTASSILWSSTCGGTFSSTTAQTVTFTAPVVNSTTSCIIKVVVTDGCNRTSFDARPITIVGCSMQVATTLTSLCFGSTNTGVINATVTNGTAPFSYNWARTGGGTGTGNSNAASFAISGLQAGTYALTVTDAEGCSDAITALTLSQASQIVINGNVTNVSCNGGNTGAIAITSVTGGAGGYTYLWTGGSTSLTRTGLTAGTYTITVTDQKTCTNSKVFTVTQPDALSIGTPTVTNVACFGKSTGQIAITASGGTTPYTYLWNDGVTTQNRTGLAAGTYAVTVTDNKNCQSTKSNIQVTQPAAALSLTSTTTNVGCGGGNTGMITVTPSGGTAPYSYNWSGTPTGDGTATITNLAAGTYSVTVTDSKSCTAVLSATVAQASSLSLSTVITHPTCPPGANPPVNSDGAITLTVTGGTSPYTYNWADLTPPPVEPKNRTGLVAGTYTVIVTDANACSATITAVLNNLNPNPVQPGVIIKN